MIKDTLATVISVERVFGSLAIRQVTLSPLTYGGDPIRDDFFKIVLPSAFFEQMPEVGQVYQVGVWKKPDAESPTPGVG